MWTVLSLNLITGQMTTTTNVVKINEHHVRIFLQGHFRTFILSWVVLDPFSIPFSEIEHCSYYYFSLFQVIFCRTILFTKVYIRLF